MFMIRYCPGIVIVFHDIVNYVSCGMWFIYFLQWCNKQQQGQSVLDSMQEMEENGMSPEEAAIEAALNNEKVMGNIGNASSIPSDSGPLTNGLKIKSV